MPPFRNVSEGAEIFGQPRCSQNGAKPFGPGSDGRSEAIPTSLGSFRALRTHFRSLRRPKHAERFGAGAAASEK